MGLKENGISAIHIDLLAINKCDKFCFLTQYSMEIQSSIGLKD
jgi:hypothetical protein